MMNAHFVYPHLKISATIVFLLLANSFEVQSGQPEEEKLSNAVRSSTGADSALVPNTANQESRLDSLSNYRASNKQLSASDPTQSQISAASDLDRKKLISRPSSISPSQDTKSSLDVGGTVAVSRQPRATTKKHLITTSESDNALTTSPTTTVTMDDTDGRILKRPSVSLKSSESEEKTTESSTDDDDSEEVLRESLKRRKLKYRHRHPEIESSSTERSSNSTDGTDDSMRVRRPVATNSLTQSSSNKRPPQNMNEEDFQDSQTEVSQKASKSSRGKSINHSNTTAITDLNGSLNWVKNDNQSGYDGTIQTVDNLGGRFQPISKRLNNLLTDQKGRVSRPYTTTNHRNKQDDTDQAQPNTTFHTGNHWKSESRNSSIEHLDWSKLVKVVFKGSNDNQTSYTVVVNSSELSNHPIKDWSNELPILLRRDFEKLIEKWSNILPSSQLIGDLGKIIVQNITPAVKPVNSSMSLNLITPTSLLESNGTLNRMTSSNYTSHSASNQTMANETIKSTDGQQSYTNGNFTAHEQNNITTTPRNLEAQRGSQTSSGLLGVDNVKEQASSLKNFMVICSVSVVVAISLVVFLMNLLLK